MVFSSALFLFIFLPVAYITAVLSRGSLSLSNILLAFISVFFYAWGNPGYAVLLLVSVAINYAIALGIDAKNTTERRRKALIVVSVALNVGMLAVFKYADFTVSNVNALFGVSIPLPKIPLPIGISFFTFQAMSYVIDVYRKSTSSQNNFLRLLLYISFFPQLIAGPIVRYGDIAMSLNSRKITLNGTAYGLRRFIFGLSKKLLIADVMGEIADKVFSMDVNTLSFLPTWVGAIAYVFQIYYDFSGYSDMAIGLGKMLGFSFKENFNYPYAAAGMRDFWRRWHISLSIWFREYVYIPLGGNRRGKTREGINKLVVFFFTGLWHGANWTFVIWGLFHGFFLMLESYGVIKTGKLPKPLLRAYTLLVVTVGFVMFRANSLSHGVSMILSMFINEGGIAFHSQIYQALSLLPPTEVVVVLIAFVSATPLARAVLARLPSFETVAFAASMPLLALSAMRLATSGYNPFIYFKF